MKLDVLIFAAHPDDAELSMGGTIIKLTKAGLSVGLIDLTRGELGTRGTPEIREAEAEEASKILGLTIRENLNLPDGKIKMNEEAMLKVVSMIRKFKPKILFAPYFNDRHPDHIGTSQIVKEAMFFTGLPKIITFEAGKNQSAYRPLKLFYFMQTYQFEPKFIVDISDAFEDKMKSVLAFGTQFYNPESKEPETFISQPKFIKYLEARALAYGFQIGKGYGEPFFCEEEIELDLINMLNKV